MPFIRYFLPNVLQYTRALPCVSAAFIAQSGTSMQVFETQSCALNKR